MPTYQLSCKRLYELDHGINISEIVKVLLKCKINNE